MSTIRKGNTMHQRTRNERGEGTIGVMVGAAVGIVILASLLAFWAMSQKNTESTSVSSRQEASMVEAFNRMGRDIQESSTVLKASPSEVVIQRNLPDGSTARTHYAVIGTSLLSKRLPNPAGYVTTDTAWQASATTIIKSVSTASPFTYQDKDGNTTTVAADVRLVEINMEALTKNGKVPLKTAASIEGGDGGTTTTVRRVDPTAANDAVNAPVSLGSVPVNVLANDVCNNGASVPCAPANLNSFKIVGTVPAGVTWSISGSTVTLTFTTLPTSAFNLTYVIADQYGSAEATITVRIPFRIGNVGAWTHGTNAVEVIGGSGPFRVERTVGGSGVVCSACSDGLGGVSGLQVTDASQPGGSTITYRVTEDSNGNGTYGDSGDQIATTSPIGQFPANVQTWSQGSERGGKFTPTRGSNIIGAQVNATGVWPTVYGLRSFKISPARSGQWEDIYINPADTIDQVVTTGTSCSGNWWSRCATDPGKAAGSESVYKAYALADVPASSAVAGDTTNLNPGLPVCTPYPGGPVPLVTYSSAKMCPSSDRTIDPDYKASQTGGGNTAWGGTREVSRAYQAPAVALASGAALTVGDNQPGYVGGDSCNDVGDMNGDNSKFSCDNGSALIGYRPWISDDPVCTRGNFWGTMPGSGNPAGCQTLIKHGSTTNGPSAAETEIAPVVNWGNVGTWVNAKTQGGTEGVWVYSCNYGGCSTDTSRAVRSYPGTVSVSAQNWDFANQYNQYWGPEAHPDEPYDCWTANRVAWACNLDTLPQIRYSWTAAAGASSYTWSSWNWTLYNDGENNPGHATYKNIGLGLQRYANVYVNPNTPNQTRLYTYAPNGLRRDTYYTSGQVSPGPSFLQDSAVCRPDVNTGRGWRYGFMFRPASNFREYNDNRGAPSGVRQTFWTNPTSWSRFWWTGSQADATTIFGWTGGGNLPQQNYGANFGGLGRWGVVGSGAQYRGNDTLAYHNGGMGNDNWRQTYFAQPSNVPLYKNLVSNEGYQGGWLPYTKGFIALSAMQPHTAGYKFFDSNIPTNMNINNGYGPVRFQMVKWGGAQSSMCDIQSNPFFGNQFPNSPAGQADGGGGVWNPSGDASTWSANYFATHLGTYVSRRSGPMEPFNKNPNPNWDEGCQFSCPY